MNTKTETSSAPEACPDPIGTSPREKSEESAPDIHQQLVGLKISLDQLGHALAEKRTENARLHNENAKTRFAQLETTLADHLKEKPAQT